MRPHACRKLTPDVTIPAGVPKPDYARLLRRDYRARRVWYARLAGGSVPDVVVSSVGPLTGSLGFQPVNLQVLSWDSITRRWVLAFDAQKVRDPSFDSSPPSGTNAYIAAHTWSRSNSVDAARMLLDRKRPAVSPRSRLPVFDPAMDNI